MTHSWWLGDDNNDGGAMGEGTRRQMQDELRGEEENAPPPPPLPFFPHSFVVGLVVIATVGIGDVANNDNDRHIKRCAG